MLPTIALLGTALASAAMQCTAIGFVLALRVPSEMHGCPVIALPAALFESAADLTVSTFLVTTHVVRAMQVLPEVELLVATATMVSPCYVQ